MYSLIQLFVRHGGLITLVVAQVISLYLMTSQNSPQQEIARLSWSWYSNWILEWRNRWLDYFSLRDENIRLKMENARLRTQLTNLRATELLIRDTLRRQSSSDSLGKKLTRPEYVIIAARVVGNTLSGRNNWLILNRGSEDGVQPHSGVISRSGVVGVVRKVSRHFSLAMSVLHPQTKISAVIRGYPYYGSLYWDEKDPRYLTLADIPYHLPIRRGDTVEVSNYSLLFPEGHVAGIVDTAYRLPGSAFLYIRVQPTQSPASIRDVYIVVNRYADELNELSKAAQEKQ
ncbi:MAG: rod shape-determining protein MreC [Saprospiraceae bacterium]|nr:rod shape-determining protein MreC [Saprospiraceae bacterium]MDW8484319.1 rod shape-determining protein MreC [Saprospiraceae bacterium]